MAITFVIAIIFAIIATILWIINAFMTHNLLNFIALVNVLIFLGAQFAGISKRANNIRIITGVLIPVFFIIIGCIRKECIFTIFGIAIAVLIAIFAMAYINHKKKII